MHQSAAAATSQLQINGSIMVRRWTLGRAPRVTYVSLSAVWFDFFCSCKKIYGVELAISDRRDHLSSTGGNLLGERRYFSGFLGELVVFGVKLVVFGELSKRNAW